MSTQTVTATEANRSFSRLLRAVRNGARIEVTAYGEVVAVLAAPEVSLEERTRRAAAFRALRRHLESVTPVTVGPWNRDDLNQR